MYLRRNLLWIDCIAGALAGATMLVLGGWLSELYGVPCGLLLFMGAANLLYAAYSFSLAARTRRSTNLILLLVLANLAWAAVCAGLAVVFRDSATPLGIAALAVEAVFVGALACLEWRWRNQLSTP
ncbi:hypothetical protein [Longimicrobium terrae]|uniref:Uncharacterized protein n=1 Tax=Longimicrobium terrae TaxID=1639882 RepID=A0A841GZQ4_9BACT|nr:hypothetical protein [Longimicrobium terrae]MBB4636751.1 hypothetical protein [Longimicrobium terrae]MBB6071250.1 hypothetical protein [Longimicrobium terrae]NNC29296.1 hypothetical protein [Longimicrobium terrae]